ncbi:hypothetical protein ACFWB2_20825 [Streptomyces virginiae]|uniref:hypothetical protein n=1 Tax=Streptomyces virginiae TaxID=1961 RepID=UPI00368EB612
MREFIALTTIGLSVLTLVLCLLPSQRKPGKHAAGQTPAQIPVSLSPGIHMTPWPTPEPDHVAARGAWMGEERTDSPLSYRAASVANDPWVDGATIELRAIKERRLAVALAELGIDYPYSYEGAPFSAAAFAAAGVTA